MSIVWPLFLSKFPSIVVESVSGLLFMVGAILALLLAVKHPLVAAFLEANAGSLLYEWKLDANGFSWKDVAQRVPAMLAACGIALLFKVL
jgi:hypothetical protein